TIAACSDPIGKYGRCGNIINDALAGTAIEPLPNGQIPAMARNSVDLPEPDGPVTSVRSPARRPRPSAATSGLPLGRFTMSLRRSIALPPSDETIPIESGLLANVVALAIDISNPSRRATTARHSASVR